MATLRRPVLTLRAALLLLCAARWSLQGTLRRARTFAAGPALREPRSRAGALGAGFRQGRRDRARARARAQKPLRASEAGTGTVAGTEADEDGTTSLPALVFNLAKNILGAGVLSLPAGVAAFSDKPFALLPAAIVMLVTGAASAYSFALLARCCELTGSRTLRGAWSRAVGPGTAWMLTLTCTAKTGMGCLMYSMILGDAASSLGVAMGAPAWLTTRSAAMLAVTLCCIAPLSFIDSSEMLKYTSMAGLSGMVFTLFAMVVRLVQGAYTPAGAFYELTAPALRPSFGVSGGSFWSPQSLVLVSCLATAYVAHYNAPKFYRDLQNRTLPRFYRMVALGFGSAAAMFIAMTAAGFLTFGGASAGFILNNYAATDGLITASRAAIAFAILCTYPLLFASLREGVIEALAGKANSTVTTAGLLTIITCVALKLRDLGSVAAVGGAIFGSGIIYIFPALTFLGATKGGKASRIERNASRGMVLFGIILAGLGTAVSLSGGGH